MERLTVDSQSIIEKPSFCEHYEPLLVEEIALASHPTAVHYGKCSIIGYLRENSSYLESLMVPALPQRLQFPDSNWSVQLCFDDYYGHVPRNCHVRIYGYVQLIGSSGSTFNSATDLLCNLKDAQDAVRRQDMNDEDTHKRIEELKLSMAKNYTPILNVQGCERVEQARELISCNLRLKRINKHMASQIQVIESEL